MYRKKNIINKATSGGLYQDSITVCQKQMLLRI